MGTSPLDLTEQSLGGTGLCDGLQPLAGAPADRAVVFELPPHEAIGVLGATHDSQLVAILEHLDGWVDKACGVPHAKPSTLGIHHSHIASHGDEGSCGGGYRRWLCRGEQGQVQSPRQEVLVAKRSESHGFVDWSVFVPFYAGSAEILGDHTLFDNELAYRRPQDLGAPLGQVVGEEAEADVVSSLREVAAQLVSDHGLGNRSDSGRLPSQQLTQRAETRFTGALVPSGAFDATAFEILNEPTLVFEGLGDRGTPDLKTARVLEEGQEGLIYMAPSLGKVCGDVLLCQPGVDSQQEEDHRQTSDGGQQDLLQHVNPVLVRRSPHHCTTPFSPTTNRFRNLHWR
jgi:hypothetical protein